MPPATSRRDTIVRRWVSNSPVSSRPVRCWLRGSKSPSSRMSAWKCKGRAAAISAKVAWWWRSKIGGWPGLWCKECGRGYSSADHVEEQNLAALGRADGQLFGTFDAEWSEAGLDGQPVAGLERLTVHLDAAGHHVQPALAS